MLIDLLDKVVASYPDVVRPSGLSLKREVLRDGRVSWMACTSTERIVRVYDD